MAFSLISLLIGIAATGYGIYLQKKLSSMRRKHKVDSSIITVPKTSIPVMLPIGLFAVATTLFNIYRQLSS